MYWEGFVHELPDKILMAATDRYLFYWQTHFSAYVFLATDGMLITHIIASIFVGCVVALVAKGREMAAIMLGLVLGAMGGVASLWARGQGSFELWMLVLRFADSVAIVLGGVIVRVCRPGPTLQAE